VRAGADVFRLNFSHGTHADHRQRLDLIRAIEADLARPLGVLLDLQGPKLRIGAFADGPVRLVEGAPFRLDLDAARPGGVTRAALPHPQIFAALRPGAELLLDDGRLRLEVTACGADFAETRVVNGGMLSDRKGVNVPGVVLPLSALTAKDRADLDFGLTLGVDWVALSFVQRAADIIEVKQIVQGRAGHRRQARKAGAHRLPGRDPRRDRRGDGRARRPRRRAACRAGAVDPETHRPRLPQAGQAGDRGHPDARIDDRAPVPTRAEASDRRDRDLRWRRCGDAVGRIGVGRFPVESVAMMDRIIEQTEADPHTATRSTRRTRRPGPSKADAIGRAAHSIAGCSTWPRWSPTRARARRRCAWRASGRARRIIGMTPRRATARRLTLVWGVSPVLCDDVTTSPT
jgi:pyruvate kinase